MTWYEWAFSVVGVVAAIGLISWARKKVIGQKARRPYLREGHHTQRRLRFMKNSTKRPHLNEHNATCYETT
jgi:hypothetical protein